MAFFDENGKPFAPTPAGDETRKKLGMPTFYDENGNPFGGPVAVNDPTSVWNKPIPKFMTERYSPEKGVFIQDPRAAGTTYGDVAQGGLTAASLAVPFGVARLGLTAVPSILTSAGLQAGIQTAKGLIDNQPTDKAIAGGIAAGAIDSAISTVAGPFGPVADAQYGGAIKSIGKQVVYDQLVGRQFAASLAKDVVNNPNVYMKSVKSGIGGEEIAAPFFKEAQSVKKNLGQTIRYIKDEAAKTGADTTVDLSWTGEQIARDQKQLRMVKQLGETMGQDESGRGMYEKVTEIINSEKQAQLERYVQGLDKVRFQTGAGEMPLQNALGLSAKQWEEAKSAIMHRDSKAISAFHNKQLNDVYFEALNKSDRIPVEKTGRILEDIDHSAPFKDFYKRKLEHQVAGGKPESFKIGDAEAGAFALRDALKKSYDSKVMEIFDVNPKIAQEAGKRLGMKGVDLPYVRAKFADLVKTFDDHIFKAGMSSQDDFTRMLMSSVSEGHAVQRQAIRELEGQVFQGKKSPYDELVNWMVTQKSGNIQEMATSPSRRTALSTIAGTAGKVAISEPPFLFGVGRKLLQPLAAQKIPGVLNDTPSKNYRRR